MSSNEDDKKVGVAELLEAAHAEGVLSPGSLQTLTGVDLGAQIQAGLGIAVDDVEASEVVLLSLMPDDSGSIRAAGNEQTVRDGHNLVLDALARSKQRDAILAHTRYLNGQILFPYLAVGRPREPGGVLQPGGDRGVRPVGHEPPGRFGSTEGGRGPQLPEPPHQHTRRRRREPCSPPRRERAEDERSQDERQHGAGLLRREPST